MKNEIIKHEDGFTSYNLGLLNDKQRFSIFETYDTDDIMHIGISCPELKDCKILTKKGDLIILNFTMMGLKN